MASGVVSLRGVTRWVRNTPKKIEADGDHMVGGDFYTDRRTTIRVDGELDRRLAPTRATTAELLQ